MKRHGDCYKIIKDINQLEKGVVNMFKVVCRLWGEHKYILRCAETNTNYLQYEDSILCGTKDGVTYLRRDIENKKLKDAVNCFIQTAFAGPCFEGVDTEEELLRRLKDER